MAKPPTQLVAVVVMVQRRFITSRLRRLINTTFQSRAHTSRWTLLSLRSCTTLAVPALKVSIILDFRLRH